MCSLEWYNNFYINVEESKAYSEYCIKVFGKDFSQQGFSDISQIDFMLEKLNIRAGDRILDIGCGNGKMLEYVCDLTGAEGWGYDFSDKAITYASERTKGKSANLHFTIAEMDSIDYASGSFDKIISVDTLYFAGNIANTVEKILRWLKSGGQFAAFYSSFNFNTSDYDIYTPDKSLFVAALGVFNTPYDVYDFTKEHYEHMKTKRRIISGMKDAFEAEGTTMLYKNAFDESIGEEMSFEEFKKFSNRQLYIVNR